MNLLDDSKVAEIQRLLIVEARSRRDIARLVGVATGTVSRYRSLIKTPILCQCGRDAKHKGWCKYRYQRSPGRQEYMKRHWEAQKTPDWVKNLAKDHKAVPDITECYPYIALSTPDRLMLAVQEAVPAMTNEARADICQDILLELLSGQLREDEIQLNVPRFIRAHRAMFGQRNVVSLDEELGESERSRYDYLEDNFTQLPSEIVMRKEEWELERPYQLWRNGREIEDDERLRDLRRFAYGLPSK